MSDRTSWMEGVNIQGRFPRLDQDLRVNEFRFISLKQYIKG